MAELEHISTIQSLRKLITPDVPVCEKCNIERLRRTDRLAEYARCPECIEKLTAKFTWVKCSCGVETSYLGWSKIDALNNSVQGNFAIDYHRTGEDTICIACHYSRLAKAWSELKSIQKEGFENQRKKKYEELYNE